MNFTIYQLLPNVETTYMGVSDLFYNFNHYANQLF